MIQDKADEGLVSFMSAPSFGGKNVGHAAVSLACLYVKLWYKLFAVSFKYPPELRGKYDREHKRKHYGYLL